MKYFEFLILTFFLLTGCVVEQGKTVVSIKKNLSTSKSALNANVSSVQIINNQLVVTGTNLSGVTAVKVNGNSIDENFTIESKSATQIIANSLQFFAFDVSKVFNLILSDASASATFAIDFSLCNATLNGKGFDCTLPANNKEVLSYDSVTDKWKPRAMNGLSYKGAWDAGTAAPTGAAAGDYYIVSDPGGAYSVGDWAVYNGATFDKIDNSTAITNVFGRTGAVSALEGDYNLDKLFDVDLSVAPTSGKVLKYDGAKWVAGDDLSGGGAGSVVTSSIANSAVTDAKIDTVSASKITGTITSTQILDGTIVNADINAAAAIDYSKLNIPNTTIPYAKLNIADGDIPYAKLTIADGSIPYAKITGGPAVASILTTTITDGDTTHAPDGNSVYDALATKVNLTGGTLTVGTINGVPTPVGGSDVVNKTYTDTQDALKVSKSGDTMTGALSINGNLNLRGTTNYVTIAADSSTATYSLTLPPTAGTNGYILSTNGSGVLSWLNPAGISVNSSAITDGSIVDADINASAAIAQSKIANLITDLAGKEPTITAGTTSQYLRGDKTLGTFASDVLSTLLAGLSTATNAVITTSDSVIAAFGKLQKQITDLDSAKLNKTGGTLTIGTISGVPLPTNADDVANKDYVDSFGQWTKTGSDLYRSSGNVGIGTSSPSTKLQISGSNSKAGATEVLSTISSSDAVDPFHLKTIIGNNSTAANRYIGLYVEEQNISTRHLVLQQYGGNVGIGTTSPSNKLQVNGVVSATQYQTAGGASFTSTNLNLGNAGGVTTFANVSATPGSNNLLVGGASASSFQTISSTSGVGTSDYINFLTGSQSEAMRILSNGNVGIGITNPGQKLTVAGIIESTIGGIRFPDGTTQTTASTSSNYGVQIKMGSFASSASTGTVNITGLGFKPTHVRFWVQRNRTGAMAGVSANVCTGSMTEDYQIAYYTYANSPAVRNLMYNDKVIACGAADAITISIQASYVSMNPDGFSLNFSPTETSWTIYYEATGGSTVASSGSGTADTIPMWTSSTGLGNSPINIDSGNVGIGTATPGQKLTVNGTIESTSGGVRYPDASTQNTSAFGPVWSVYSNSSPTTNNSTWVKVPYNQVEFDSNSSLDAANSRIRPTKAGYYRVSLSIQLTQTAPGGGLTNYLSLYKNGSSFKAVSGLANYNSGYSQSFNVTALVYMNGTTDYLEGWWTTNVANLATLTPGSSHTHFSGEWVRP